MFERQKLILISLDGLRIEMIKGLDNMIPNIKDKEYYFNYEGIKFEMFENICN